MTMKRGRGLRLVLVAWVAGCGGGSEPGTVVLDRVDGDFFARPFPRDDRKLPSGALDLAGFPAQIGLLGRWMADLGKSTYGFGLNSGVFFRLSGPIDPATLPATPEASLLPDASVFLVDLDHDKRIPLLARFEPFEGNYAGPNLLGLMPLPGLALAPATRYAAIITRRVEAMGGGAIGRASGLDLSAALYAPVRDWLTRKGELAQADIAGVTVFTTANPQGQMQALLEAAQRDAPSVAPTMLGHSSEATWEQYEGSYSTPIYLSGTAPYSNEGGTFVPDAAGKPVLQGSETGRFTIAVPKTAAPAAGFPVLVYGHGSSGSRLEVFAPPRMMPSPVAELIAKGFVVLSFDSTLHGTRTPPGAVSATATTNFENLAGSRDISLQSAADALIVLRLVQSWPATLVLPDTAATVKLDAGRIVWVGYSRGALTGLPMLSRQPGVRAVVVAGAAAHGISGILGLTFPMDAKAFLKLALNEDVDLFHPMLTLFGTVLDPFDAANFLPEIFAHPAAGVPSRSLLVIMGVTDTTVGPGGSRASVLAAGATLLGAQPDPIEHLGLAGITAQATGALTGNGPGGVSTGATIQVTATGYDGHDVFLRDAPTRQRWIDFAASAVAGSGPPTLSP